MTILLKIIQVIVALSILVLVHEFGHFFFARIFKIRVEKFYLFFDTGFALFRWKPKNSDTEYGIGWLPFGGYCKISGMVDESMDTNQLKSEPLPWEFRAHPAWQRFFVLFGGVFFNFLLAIVIYAGMLCGYGEKYIKNQDVTTGIAVNALAQEMGFRNGDRIIAFDGKPIERFDDLRADLIHSQAKEATIIRDGKDTTIKIDESYMPAILNSGDLFSYGVPFVVDSIPPESPNTHAGLVKGDIVTGIDSISTPLFAEVKEYIAEHKSDTVLAHIQRVTEGDTERVSLPLAVDDEGLIGVYIGGDLAKYYKITERKYSLAESIPAGAKRAVQMVGNYWKELKLIVKPKTQAYKSVGSFIAIGQIFPGYWDWYIFWSITAFLSIMLGVLNILPIPALDGGHILFTLYEMITGHKASDKVLIIAQYIGMILLIALMMLAFGNDIMRLLR